LISRKWIEARSLKKEPFRIIRANWAEEGAERLPRVEHRRTASAALFAAPCYPATLLASANISTH
jgi:hypothetical protein